MLIWIIEIILTVLLLRLIESIGLKGSCGIMALVCAINAAVTGAGFMAILYALIHGAILGLCAFIGAKILLFLIDLFGAFFEIIIYFLAIVIILAIIF